MHSEPQIIALDPLWVVGLAYHGSMKAQTEIPKLWEIFNQRFSEVPARDLSGEMYGVFFSTPEEWQKGKMTYLAAIAVDSVGELPKDMHAKQIEGGLYAMLTHKGPLLKIIESIDYLFRTWISQSEYEIDDRAGFELYDKRFKFDDPSSEFDIFAPVKMKNV